MSSKRLARFFSAARPRVLSGIQPTGALHIGNYAGKNVNAVLCVLLVLGALQQWVSMQDNAKCFFCVVDMHAITLPQNPTQLHEDTIKSAAIYLAAGIDPSRSSIFIQSQLSAHAELAWMLNCITPMSWLERMVQFKEKSATQHGDNIPAGLLNYPTLMAADILLYRANIVPVGSDQLQHLELTRDICRRFNHQFRCKTFIEPQPMIITEKARIMSLLDGSKKMSKSAENDASRINLLDAPDVILKKIKRCKTDTIVGLSWDDPSRVECVNLLNIYHIFAGKSKDTITSEVKDMTWGAFKPLLAEAVIEHLRPIQDEFHRLMDDRRYIEDVLWKGREEAYEVASQTLSDAKKAMGLVEMRDRYRKTG